MRGNSRQLIYLTDIDRGTFMELLRRTIVRHGWELHGYCLMDNHFHLLVQTAEPTISTGMCYLNSLYARRFNNRHGLRGHLFERRFHAEIVKTDEHLRELIRYLALNPVRAGLCMSPADWRWSSYRSMVGLEPAPDFLTAGLLRAQFWSVAELERFVLEGLKPLPSPIPWV